jgi:glycosyltransferase involved in cell wall biosynthesis
MQQRPLVSVGLPTFNRAGSLKRAIESVLVQDYSNLELVISDNASTDETSAICADFCERDNRIRYFRKMANRGATANFQEVLERSTGEYFMWLGDDDWLHPSYISRCLETLVAHRDFSLVCGTSKYFDDENVVFEGAKINLVDDSPQERVLSFYRQVSDNGTFYGLVLRDLLVTNPIQNTLAGDWLLMAALAMKGRVRTLNDVAIYRSRVGASLTWDSLAGPLGLSKKVVERPYQTITSNVFKDIVMRSRVYGELGTLGRWALAAKTLRVLYKRFRDPLINESSLLTRSNRIRYRLKVRTRIKRALSIVTTR